MMTFTMAMSGTSKAPLSSPRNLSPYHNHISVEEKLHWSFKLYDLDGNEEIDMYEMEKIVRY